MDSTRISLARVLELGVSMSWREAAAIVYEAMARTVPTKGARPSWVNPGDCLLTRGGDLQLTGDALRARPETILGLLDHLLAVCDSPGGLGPAFEAGRANAFLDDLALQITDKKRRVEIAGVAIRALGLDADQRRLEAERRLAAERREAAEREAALLLAAEHAARDAVSGVADETEAGAPEEPFELPADLPLDLMPHDAPAWSEQWMRSGRGTPGQPPPTARRREADRWQAAASSPAMGSTIAVDDEFQQLRAATLRTAATANDLDLWRRVGQLASSARLPTAIAAFAAAAAGGFWLAWPAPTVRVPEAPSRVHAAALRAVPLPAEWAEFGRAAASSSVVAAAPVGAGLAPAPTPALATPPEPPGAPIIVPPAAAAPVAPAATIAPPAVASAPAEVDTAASSLDDALFSAATPGVTPPVLRYPAMPSTALRAGTEPIVGPHFEVLVAADGSVETVRIRGQIEPGETFYRHRMMLAAAKMWRFTPAMLNGRPVRYVARVVVDEP